MVGSGKYRYHSPVISAEWCAFTNVPWGRGLINFEPHEDALAMETYATWARLFELQRYYSWIIDRFHISTIVYQRCTHGREFDFRWLEERLLPLGFRLVLLHAARRRSRRRAQNASRRPAIRASTTTVLFIAEQDEMRFEVGRSLLPSFELDVSDDDVEGAADRVAAWLEATGGSRWSVVLLLMVGVRRVRVLPAKAP